MPAPANVAEFLDLVRRSGLLPDAKLDQLIDRHRAANTLPQTTDQFAALLVRDAHLTFFQAKQLKLGRYKRFTIGAKYRLLELIGAGGMGAVYLCEHTLMKRLVALKVLPIEKLEEQSNLERFHREARAVAALDHPNIVRAYDIDQHEKLHFLVMEYVDGNSLQEVIARHGPMDPIRTAHYIAQAAIGIQHAHELGMVHRDIKPGNLLLDRTGVIKVLDMGLARFFNKPADSVTEKYDQNCVLGTADYLAPEQAVSNQVDIRADIYSLGGTMYFMLTGQTPFPDGTIAAKLVAHQTKEPKPVEAFRSDVPPEMLEVLRNMMTKHADDRYQEPIEVAEALSEWADLEIEQPPPKEMPGLCPLVLSLTGHSVDKGNSQVPLARTLFGPGRSVFRSGGSSSSITARAGGKSGAVGTRTSGSSASGERPIRVSPPVSTARTHAQATAPIGASSQPPRSGSHSEPGTADYEVAPRKRTGLFILLGIVALALVAAAGVAVVAAYQLGKANNKSDAGATHNPSACIQDNHAPH